VPFLIVVPTYSTFCLPQKGWKSMFLKTYLWWPTLTVQYSIAHPNLFFLLFFFFFFFFFKTEAFNFLYTETQLNWILGLCLCRPVRFLNWDCFGQMSIKGWEFQAIIGATQRYFVGGNTMKAFCSWEGFMHFSISRASGSPHKWVLKIKSTAFNPTTLNLLNGNY